MPQTGVGSMQGSSKSRFPLRVIFHCRSSSNTGRLSLKVVFHRRSSFTEGRLPLKAVFHSIFSRGHIVSKGILSSWGGLSPLHIVLEAYRLGAGSLRGRLSQGQVVSGACFLRAYLQGILSPGALCLQSGLFQLS